MRQLEGHAKRRYVDPAGKALLRRLLEEQLGEREVYDGRIKHTTNPSESADPEEPETIVALRQEAIPLHKEYSHLKAELFRMVVDDNKYSNEDRYTIAYKIMQEVLPTTDAIYDQIRAWNENGTLPPGPEDRIKADTVKKVQRVYSLRSRISRLKSSLKGKLDDKKRKEYEAELLDKEIEVQQLELELGMS